MPVGDLVVYAADPLLYGVMEVSRVRRDGRVECKSAARALAWPKNLIEVFEAGELAPLPAPADAGAPTDTVTEDE